MVKDDDRGAALRAELFARPGERAIRQIYADWLEQHGEVAAAAWLRMDPDVVGSDTSTQELRLGALAVDVDPELCARATLGPIEACDRPACPRRWEALPASELALVRTCGVCARAVELSSRAIANSPYVRDLRWHRDLGGTLQLKPFSLELVREPDDEAHLDRRILAISARADSPVRIQIVGHFTNHRRSASIEDRRFHDIERATFDKVLVKMKVCFEVGGTPDAIVIERVNHFDPADLEQRLRALLPEASGAELTACVMGLRARQDFRDAEASWRALHHLVHAASERVIFSILNCSKYDLAADMEDARPAYQRSGLGKIINPLNHKGIRPSLLTILGFNMDPRQHQDVELLEAIGYIAASFSSPIVIGAVARGDDLEMSLAPELDAFRRAHNAPWVALAAPDWVVYPRSAYGPPVLASAAYLVGLRLVDSLREHAIQLQGVLHGVHLDDSPNNEHGDVSDVIGRTRGYCIFTRNGEIIRLRTDANCARGVPPEESSFTLTLMIARIVQQIANIDLLHVLPYWHELHGAESAARRLSEVLATRLQKVTDLDVRVVDAYWPTAAEMDELELELELSFGRAFTDTLITHYASLRVRLR